jgi:hypothetical protein
MQEETTLEQKTERKDLICIEIVVRVLHHSTYLCMRRGVDGP